MQNYSEIVKNAGVIGAGGAGFPTHIKMLANVDMVIANGAECEPILSHDRAGMVSQPERILRGLDILAQAAGAKRKIFAVKKKYSDAIEALKPHLGKTELLLLPDYYPAGDEAEIVKLATGKTIPENGLPLNVGAVVDNTETLANIAAAVDEKRAVTERNLTVCGEVKKPGVYKVPVGMKIADLLKHCGGTTCENPVIYTGGPMMGGVTAMDRPVTKTTTGIFVLPEEHYLIQKRSISMPHIVRQAQSACTDCRMCTDVCPRYLLGHDIEPHKIMRTVNLGIEGNTREMLSAHLCCFCGACEYACPMMLSPRRVYEKTLGLLREKNVVYPKPVKELIDHTMREFRRIPSHRLTGRMGLNKYDIKMPVYKEEIRVSEVTIPLKQHIGIPAEAVVKVGTRVLKGEVIGEIPAGKVGARVHASMDGVVKEVNRGAVVIRGDI